MIQFVQLEITEYERLKEFEKLVEHNTVFSKYEYDNGETSYSAFNAPQELRDMETKLRRVEQEQGETIRELQKNIRDLQREIILLKNRSIWERIINKEV